MKQLIFITILKLLLPVLVQAQSNVIQKLVVPSKVSVNAFNKIIPAIGTYSFKNLNGEDLPGNNLLSFLNGQPLIRLTGVFRKSAFIFTEFSFPDVMENTMNGINAGWVNTYDDHIPELFKDAPSLFTIKGIISF